MVTLEASYCKCGKIFVPPQEHCLNCLSETENFQINDNGQLLTFTFLNVVPDDFSDPMILGLAEIEIQKDLLPDIINGFINPKIVCQGSPEITSEDELKVGQKIEIEKINNIYVFKICDNKVI
jgi:uncharacterized OB-fold protein